jgi:hypothetical protein
MSFAKDVEIYGENEPADYAYRVLTGTVRVHKILQTAAARSKPSTLGDIFGMELVHHASSVSGVGFTITVVRRATLLAAVAKDADAPRVRRTRRRNSNRPAAMRCFSSRPLRNAASFLIDISNRLRARR